MTKTCFVCFVNTRSFSLVSPNSLFFILTAIHGLLIMGFYFSSLNFISRPLELGGPPGTNLRGVC